jgi:hypothetical protein
MWWKIICAINFSNAIMCLVLMHLHEKQQALKLGRKRTSMPGIWFIPLSDNSNVNLREVKSVIPEDALSQLV